MPEASSFSGLPPEVGHVYGAGDLSQNPCFAGGFINFGHWASVDLTAPLTTADRLRSQQDLYRLVLAELDLEGATRTLEVGCGRGLGCLLALTEFGPAEVHGVDVHPDQVRRARAGRGGGSGHVHYWVGAAAALPFLGDSFDRLYSVEAAQHFRSVDGFVAEASRVLVPGGRFAVSTFFATRTGLGDRLAETLHSFASGLDVAHALPEVLASLERHGFTDVTAASIGAQVWPGLDRWVASTVYADAWPRNFLRANDAGLLDYYLVTAALPQPS